MWMWLRRTWSAPAWWATGHVVLGAPIGLATALTMAVLATLTATLAVTVALAVVTFVQLLIFNGMFTSWQRSRFAALLGVDIPSVPRHRDPSMWRWALSVVRAGSTWRQIGYHLFAGVFGPAAAVVVVGTWCLGLLATGAFALPGALLNRAVLTICGPVFLCSALWLARTLAAVDAGLARWLLGPSRRDELAFRVESLTASRAALVAAADTERRRIERDLHDGTQQRLTSLALNLGIARATFTDLPAPAREALVQAHDEAKQASAELRDLVRGMYPAVLHDRGLDAALSGIAARAPLPVRLRVEVTERVAPAVEAVAYFVVSEALNNVARHADASAVEVAVERVGDRLHVTVRDDGRGGAVVGAGSGLRGLVQRTASVDGTLRIESPTGGPTTIFVELPCES
jgi:signal transduction histidine kinase